MSALYEIQEDILSCIDLKTGEIIDVERLHGLQMERRQKIRNIACWIKNLLADARAYEEEEKSFASLVTLETEKTGGKLICFENGKNLAHPTTWHQAEPFLLSFCAFYLTQHLGAFQLQQINM